MGREEEEWKNTAVIKIRFIYIHIYIYRTLVNTYMILTLWTIFNIYIQNAR